MWRKRINFRRCGRIAGLGSEIAAPAAGNPNKLRTDAESGILRWETTRFQLSGYQCWGQRWLTHYEASTSTISLKHSPHRRQMWRRERNARENQRNQPEGLLPNLASSRGDWKK